MKQGGRDDGLTRRAFDLCVAAGVPSLAPRVTVRWNPRMRSTAGRAFWPEALIEMNPALRDISAKEVERTFLHELAHLITYERVGNRRIQPHGIEWQQTCSELGISGERAGHRLPLPRRTLSRKWRYVCPHCRAHTDRVRRMRGNAACRECCLQFAGGAYDRRFRFVEQRIVSRPREPGEANQY